MMDARATDSNTLRAELYLCLARAFETPSAPAVFEAMRDALADDLGDLAAELSLDVAEEVADFRRRMGDIADAGALLQIYSRLFLQPPLAVHINTGVYLDGAMNGASLGEMEEWYRQAGLQRAEDFRDLSDHAALQLEFVAFLYGHALDEAGEEGRGAGEFVGRFVARWAPALVDNLKLAERELDLAGEPYLPLARILAKAALRDAEAPSDLDPARLRRERALAGARRKQAMKGITPDDLKAIRAKLASQGLAVDHLGVDYAQRDAARGWRVGTPPAPRRR
jgi:TorA maturation chaperone TorD